MNKKRIALLFLIISLTLLFTLNTTAENLKIHFIDIGQGDSILIQAAAGENILVDGGDRADAVAEKIISYLKAQNVKKIDYLISTHPHADHIGSLTAVIDNFEVEKILDSGKVHSSKTYENYLLKIDQKNIDFAAPRRGDIIELKKGKIKFIHPDSKIADYSLNNSSLVFVLNYKKQKFLFTGDIEKEVEQKLLLKNPELKVDIIKVPHHGSSSSSSWAWIKSLEPKTAVIQVGAANSYGHPAPETTANYRRLKTAIYRNDLNGDIVITADGENYTVKVDKNLSAGSKKQKNLLSKNDKKLKVESSGHKLININQADAKTLSQLWGIGSTTAAKIITYRQKNGPFQQIEEIMNVKGIGKAKFERWQHKISVN